MAPPSFGQRAADRVARALGSWRFLGIQSCIIAIWVVVNLAGFIHLDVWPFVFLNLCLSLQAAYSAPVLQMASNRQSAIDASRDDREAAEVDTIFDHLATQDATLAHLETQLTYIIAALQPWTMR